MKTLNYLLRPFLLFLFLIVPLQAKSETIPATFNCSASTYYQNAIPQTFGPACLHSSGYCGNILVSTYGGQPPGTCYNNGYTGGSNSCPPNQGYTLQGTSCVRPDCGQYQVRDPNGQCTSNGLPTCSDIGPSSCPQYQVLNSTPTNTPSSCNGTFQTRSCVPNGLSACPDDGPTSCGYHYHLTNTSYTSPSSCNGEGIHRTCDPDPNTCSVGYKPDPDGPGCLPTGSACIVTGNYTCPLGPNGPPACSPGFKPDPDGGPGCVASNGSACVASPKMGCSDSNLSASSSCAWVSQVWTCADSNTGIKPAGSTSSGLATGTGLSSSGQPVATDQCGGVNAPACSYIPHEGTGCDSAYQFVNGVCTFKVIATAPDQSGPPSTHACTGANDPLCTPTQPLHDGSGQSGCLGGFHLSNDFCTANNSPAPAPQNAPTPTDTSPSNPAPVSTPRPSGTSSTTTTTTTTTTNPNGTTTATTTGQTDCPNCATESTLSQVLDSIGKGNAQSAYSGKPYQFKAPSNTIENDVASAKTELSDKLTSIRNEAQSLFSVDSLSAGQLPCTSVDLGAFGVHSFCLEPYRDLLAQFRPALIAAAWIAAIFIILG